MVSTGAPDSSSWPAGSSVTEAHALGQRDHARRLPVHAFLDRVPAEAGQALQQRLDAALAVEGRRPQVVEAEAELLVLGTDAPVDAASRRRP
jgi:hypothetical protein